MDVEQFQLSHWKNNIEQCHSFILKQLFNHKVSIVATGLDEIPISIPECISSNQVYHVANLPLHTLLRREFIGAFFKSGTFHMISQDRNMDYDNCAAILPSGELLLHLTRDSYHKLGLEGRPVEARKRNSSKYVVTIKPLDLAASSKLYARTLLCLEKFCPMRMDFVFTWTPHDRNICPSSVQRYFQNMGHECVLQTPNVDYRSCDLQCPVIDSSKYTPDVCGDESCDYTEVFDWLGAVTCNANVSGTDGYLSTYCGPSVTSPGKCVIHSTTGVIPPDNIARSFDALCELSERTQQVVFLTVHSFRDNPCSTARQPISPNKQTQFYTYVLFPDGRCWLLKVYNG